MVKALLTRMLDAGGAERPLTADEMIALGKGVDLDTLDLGDYRCFRDECYARNRVELNEHFELVVICWGPGQQSSIHDHGVSNCLYLVVEGTMDEEQFEPGDGGKPVSTKKTRYGPGDITLAEGHVIHRISNHTDGKLVTVHIYSPPLDTAVTHYTPVPHYA